MITEFCILLQRNGGQPAEVLKNGRGSVTAVALELQTEAAALETLMRSYDDTRMSLTARGEGPGRGALTGRGFGGTLPP